MLHMQAHGASCLLVATIIFRPNAMGDLYLHLILTTVARRNQVGRFDQDEEEGAREDRAAREA